MYPRGRFFFFCVGGRVMGYLDFCCSSQVLTTFSSSSQWVPNMFLKLTMCSLTCSQLHFTFSHMLCPILFSWKLCSWANIETYVSMFGANTFKLGSPQSLRIFLGWANKEAHAINFFLNLEGTYQLINMNHAAESLACNL
jgi:hypothetical protein